MYTDQTLEFERVETSNGTFREEIILFLKQWIRYRRRH